MSIVFEEHLTNPYLISMKVDNIIVGRLRWNKKTIHRYLPNICYNIDNIYIIEKYRGNNYAKELIYEFEKCIKLKNPNQNIIITLKAYNDINDINKGEKLTKYYEEIGFVKTKSRSSISSNNEITYLCIPMKKYIN